MTSTRNESIFTGEFQLGRWKIAATPGAASSVVHLYELCDGAWIHRSTVRGRLTARTLAAARASVSQ